MKTGVFFIYLPDIKNLLFIPKKNYGPAFVNNLCFSYVLLFKRDIFEDIMRILSDFQRFF